MKVSTLIKELECLREHFGDDYEVIGKIIGRVIFSNEDDKLFMENKHDEIIGDYTEFKNFN